MVLRRGGQAGGGQGAGRGLWPHAGCLLALRKGTTLTYCEPGHRRGRRAAANRVGDGG
jgi:hypothetical protein